MRRALHCVILETTLFSRTGHLKAVGDLRNSHPGVKVLLAVGGWNAGSPPFSKMSRSSSTRRTFVDSVVALLDEYNYDGLDLDWEYPTQRGGIPADKQNFNLLIQVGSRFYATF